MSRRNKRGKKGLARTIGKRGNTMREATRSFERGNQEKLSARIIAIGGHYLTNEELSLEERQSRLNAVSSAWNMAILSPARRQEALAEYLETYYQYPDHTMEDNAAVRRLIESLIEEKLRQFPHDQRFVSHAQVTMSGNKAQVNVATMVAAP